VRDSNVSAPGRFGLGAWLWWWTLPVALFVLLAGVSGLQRTARLWDLDILPPDIVRLTPGGVVSQPGYSVPWALRGFVAQVNSTTESGLPVNVQLRIRKFGETREILREATASIESNGYVEITTGLMPPLLLDSETPVEYEIQLATNSPGSISIAGSASPNYPAHQLTINGARTLPELRASITPIATFRTVSLLRSFIRWNFPFTLTYAGVSFLACLVGFVLLRRILGATSSQRGRPLPLSPFLASAIPATGIALAASTATFSHSSGRYFMLEIAEGYWASVFTYLLLWDIGLITLGGLMNWLRHDRAGYSDWITIIRQAFAWQSWAKLGLTTLALSVPMALVRIEPVAQFLASTAVVIVIVAILRRGVDLVADYAGWIAIIRQACTWQSWAKLGLATLVLSVPIAVLHGVYSSDHIEPIAQFLAGTAVVIVIVAILRRSVDSVRSG